MQTTHTCRNFSDIRQDPLAEGHKFQVCTKQQKLCKYLMNIFNPHVTSYTHIYWQQLRYSKCRWSTHMIPLKPENECVRAAIWTSEKSKHKIVHKTVQEVDEHFNTQCFGAVQTEPKCEQATQNCFHTAADELFEVHSSTIKSQYPARPSKTTPLNRLTARHFIERIPLSEMKAKPILLQTWRRK